MVGIETSQHVKLSYEPAGVGERVLAFFWMVLSGCITWS